MTTIEPAAIADALGRPRPTDEQAAVIAGPLEPTLVVAGAGAGKTETMASRVVWLVANGLVLPSEVLGLTFTRKAAAQLSRRIRERLQMLARSPLGRGPGAPGGLAEMIRTTDPQISTYDSYAGALVSSYGLLVPVESDATLFSETAVFQLAHDVVSRWDSPLASDWSVGTLTDRVLALAGELTGHLRITDELRMENRALLERLAALPEAEGKSKGLNDWIEDTVNRQAVRDELADMVDAVDDRIAQEGGLTFGRQTAIAATLGSEHPSVGAAERAAFRVVLLDEYQDTGYAQRAMLSGLFGQGRGPIPAVTAVGDPMQSIYGWRGATASNLPLFQTDFPREDGSPARVLALSTSWRNPRGVLELANRVTSDFAGRPGTVDVPELAPRPGADRGGIRLGLFDTIDDERSWIADSVASEYRSVAETGTPPTAAILVRANADAAPFAELLAERGIPVEIVGAGGLLDVPEVRDVLALLRIAADPRDSDSGLRLLTSPRYGLGPHDLEALRARSRGLSLRPRGRAQTGTLTTVEQVEEAIDDLVGDEDTDAAGLVDALSDPGPEEQYSRGGYRRIRGLAGAVSSLRANLASPPARLVAAAARELGLDIETRVRYLTGRGDGSQHLDELRSVAASFAPGVAATLTGFLDYLDVARDKEKGLTRGATAAQPGRVQILTIHSAKGLEWDIVAVPHLTKTKFPQKLQKTSWIRRPEDLPSHLRGDRHSDENPDGMPVFEAPDSDERKEFREAIEDFGARTGARELDEARRLFYVAVTRSERVLLMSGYHWGTQVKPLGPSDFLVEMAEMCGLRDGAAGTEREYPGEIVAWSDEPPEENPVAAEQVRASWPGPSVHSPDDGGARARAAHAVRRAEPYPLGGASEGAEPAETTELAAGPDETSPAELTGARRRWIAEAEALVAERESAAAPVDVPLPRRMSASQVVAYRDDPERFRARLRRPVPLKPNRFARKGTRFHAWLEHRFGATHLLDLDDLPGAGDDVESDADLLRLQEAFESSTWAGLVPDEVEVPFEVGLGDTMLRGRIDAVFSSARGWTVVDWKTGAVPTGRSRESAVLQLAVYRYAWARVLEQRTGEPVDPESVRAVFHYIRHDYTLEPTHLPGAGELLELLDDSAGDQA